jgi:predicted nucleic acid-binding protein
LVIDANVALAACARPDGFEALADELAAPPLMWSEGRSTLHLQKAKGTVTAALAETLHQRLDGAPVEREDPPGLGGEAWRVAEVLGWGRTYDAEYVALAAILGCRLVTLDMRLRRGADRLGFVIMPSEL